MTFTVCASSGLVCSNVAIMELDDDLSNPDFDLDAAANWWKDLLARDAGQISSEGSNAGNEIAHTGCIVNDYCPACELEQQEHTSNDIGL